MENRYHEQSNFLEKNNEDCKKLTAFKWNFFTVGQILCVWMEPALNDLRFTLFGLSVTPSGEIFSFLPFLLISI